MNELGGIISRFETGTTSLVKDYNQADADNADEIKTIFEAATEMLRDLQAAEIGYSELLNADRENSLKTLTDLTSKIKGVIENTSKLSPQGLSQQEAPLTPLLDLKTTTIININDLKSKLSPYLIQVKNILNSSTLTLDDLRQIESSLGTITQDTARLFNSLDYVKDRDIESVLINFEFLELTDLIRAKEKTFAPIKSPSINQSIKKESKDSYKNYILPFTLLVFFGSYLTNNNFLFFACIASALFQLTLRTNTPSKELSLPKWKTLEDENLSQEDLTRRLEEYRTELEKAVKGEGRHQNVEFFQQAKKHLEDAIENVRAYLKKHIPNDPDIEITIALATSTPELDDLSTFIKARTRPNIGEKEPSNNLKDKNTLSNARVDQLAKLGVSEFRPIRGDGNCYYRACMVGLFEQILSTSETRIARFNFIKEQFDLIPNKTAENDFFISQLKLASEGKIWNTLKELEESLLNPTFDHAMIRSTRDLLSNWTEKNRKEEIEGLAFEQLTGNHDEYMELIRTMDTCAEGPIVNMSVLGNILGFTQTIFEVRTDIDRLHNIRSLQTKGPSAYQENIVLLLRGGHYTLLYRK